MPLAVGLHVPLWHAKQVWLHAESQQAPSTQKPLAHWSAPAHGSPRGFRDWQVPSASQNELAPHWESCVQEEPVELEQTPPSQLRVSHWIELVHVEPLG